LPAAVANDPLRSPEIAANTIDANATAQAASVAEALHTGKHPERLSPLMAPTPWDRAAFERDPDAYLRIAEPGRGMQAAPEGEGIPVLERITPRVVEVAPGATTVIEVRTEPFMPASALSTDLGRFSASQLPFATTRADEAGIARFTFEATAGTTGEVQIQIASPVASEIAHVTVQVAAVEPQSQP
jgi:hypothetical protein